MEPDTTPDPVSAATDPAAADPLAGRDAVRASAPAGTQCRAGFGDDFRRFFVSGLKTLLPTLITLWLLFWVWDFLWQNIGRHVIWVIKWLWVTLQDRELLPERWYFPAGRLRQIFDEDSLRVRALGVGLSILVVYVVGVFVGNLIGRTAWRLLERTVMRLPLIRAIYPSVKQVTDFLLADRGKGGPGGGGQFKGGRVVAVQARHQGVWSIGIVTGRGYGPINDALRDEMVTVFIPSSPTAVAGYVVVAHRKDVIDLPLTVEEALRLLISGGVLIPGAQPAPQPPLPTALPPEQLAAGGPVAQLPAGGAVILLPGTASGAAVGSMIGRDPAGADRAIDPGPVPRPTG